MINFLKTISENNIYLNLIDGELKLFSENENIDPELLKEIKSRKAEIISYLEENKGFQAQAKNNNEIPVLEEADSYELSDSQKQLWIMSKMEGASVAYNIPNQVVLNGEYDINYFSKAINWVIDRHEILRTIFKENAQGEIRQWVLSQEELGFSIDYCDFRNEENSEDAVREYIKEDSYKAFDLSNGPLLRASLLQVVDDSYVFYYNMHHIISDGWSMEVLGRDVLTCYNAFAKAETPTIPALRIQYKEYAAWQQAQIQDGKAKEQKEYWLNQLSGELPVLNLPNQKTRPVVKTYNGASLSTGISSKETKELKNFTQNNGGSLFMSLVAVWNVLIHKYTSQKDIITGTPIAGRNHLDLENQIGFYVNMLALRNEINPEENFISLFKKVKDNTLKSFENQQYPFDRLIQDLEIQKDRSRSPIFDAIVVLQNTSDNTYAIDENENVIHNITDLGVTNSKYDLELIFQEVGDNLLFKINYNTDVYDSSTIETLINHYKNLLSSVLVNPSSNISELEYLSAQEVALQLEEFSTTITTYPSEASIVDLFTEQALKTPDAVALSYGDRSVTYQELDELSNQVAHYLLLNHTIEVEDFVGIRLEKSDWTLIAILGVLKSGGVYVPIDPNYPSQRIAYIEKDTNCKVTIDNAFLTEFKNTSLELPTISPGIEIAAGNLAYVMYTSGSTGIPKGVMVEHRNVIRLVKNSNFYNFSNTDVLLSTGSFSFDATTFEYWGPLLNGGELVICSQETLLGVESLSNEIKNKRASVMWFTAGWLNQLVDTDIDLFNSLSTVLVGGDRLSPSHIGKLRSQYPSLEIINGYGPTENTTFSLTYNIGDVSGDIPIGYPISNSSVYILDEHQSLVVRGGIGEIYLGGDGLSRGYLNQAELTTEKFVDDRFRESGKLYKTGDLGYWNEDGSLSFIGRKDAQVKIRGYRIELPEIEARLLQQNNIDKAVVEVIEIEGQKCIVAYISSGTLIDKKSVKESLQVELPDYMLPSYYVVLDSMPLNPNGKVDRKALPAVSEDDIIKEEYVAPRTIEERVLVEVLQQILKRDAISIKDNFYNLGGDSIKSIQVVSRLKQQGYSLKVDDILRNPVLEYLSKLLLKDTRVIDQLPVEGEVELTPIQEGFFSNSKIRVLDHFNQSVLLKSTEAIDLVVLRKSVSALVAHHDILRAVYNKSGSNWSQVNKEMSSEDHYTLDSYDLRNDEDAFATMGALGLELQSSINIGDGPLMKVGHFQLPSGEERLAIIIHHLVIDGVSWRILLEDLSNAYLSHKQGISVELPLKTDSFQRWASLQKEYANSDIMDEELPYWEGVSALSVDPFPVDKKSKEASIHFDKRASFVLDTVMTDLLQTKTNRVYNTEVNDILLTSLGLAIQDVFGIDRSIIEMEGHGREDIIEDVDVSRTVGWFTSVYPFVLDMSDSGAKREGLVQVKEDLRKIPKKGIGYGILKYLSDSFTSSVKPSIVFNYLGDFGDDVGGVEEAVFEYASEDIGTDNSRLNGENALLSISGMMVTGQLTISIKYSDVLYQSDTIERLASSYQEHLSELITDLSSDAQNYITPSDVTYKGLSTKELALLNKDNNIEDVYKLSPLQQGIYYHWLSDNSTSLYFEQMSYRLRGIDLNVESVKQAYDLLISRHSVLRTSFTNDYAGESLQVVRKKISSNFSYEKIVEKTDFGTINEQIERIKYDDRKQGFDLEGTSQMRLKVLDLGDGLYEFVWSFHHILMDGWCISILINDFGELLSALENKVTANLPVPVRYSNYIEWLDTLNKTASLDYWRDYLLEYENVASIPFKRENTEEKAYQLEEEKLKVEGDLLIKVNQVCSDLEITQNTLIQGVWGYLLSKYTNTQDVVFGSVVSGRPGDLLGVEEMIGLFINTIPVRVKYKREDSPRTLLKMLHDQAISGSSHHYLNLSEVQSQSELGMNLMDHIMIFENYPIQDVIKEDFEKDQSQKLTIEAFEAIEQTNYDFNVVIAPSASSVSIDFSYNGAKYSKEEITKLANHFYSVLEQFCFKTEDHLSTINYLSEKERNELLLLNDTEKEYPTDKNIVQLFEEQVKRVPGGIAVVFGNRKLTYLELDVLSNQLAHCIVTSHKVAKNDIVGIKLDRSEWCIVSILAILKLGATYVPIDTKYPEERIAYIESDSACTFCIDDFYLNEFLTSKNEYLSTPLNIEVTPEDIAYIIYTSGSTGHPKGVLVDHASVVNIFYGWRDSYSLNSFKVNLLQLASFSFDMSVADFCRSILNGGTMIICGDDMKLDQVLLYNLIDTHKVSVFEGTPSLVIPLMKYIHEEELSIESLKMLILGGESLSLFDFGFLADSFGDDIQIINSYGVTEATVDSTYYVYNKEEAFDYGINTPIGKPFPNVSVFIVDDYNNLVPKGVIGELCISGSGVTRGYLDRADLTRNKFVSNPFLEDQKMYKTGDLARWLPDGNVEFMGRADDQVKIRGHRIELSEIEYHLSIKEDVKDALVLVKDTGDGVKDLVAYVVSDQDLNIVDIRSYLSSILPSYMIPAHYIKLDEIPVTVNGKLDKKALPSIVDSGMSSGVEYIAPSTLEEKTLASVWSDVLKRTSISIKDNFYNLGGDSIKSIQVVSRIKQKGYSLKVEHILRYPILQDLASLMDKDTRDVDQSTVTGIVPLTPIQHYFFNNPCIANQEYYNQSVLLKSNGPIDSTFLKLSISSLVNHHDALRMVYKKNEKGWEQINNMISDTNYSISFYDLQTEDEPLDKMHQLGKELQSSIDLHVGPLFKIGHFRLKDGDRLALIIHHLIIDGISWRILLEDLATLYSGYSLNSTPKLPLKTDSFQRWGLQQQTYAQSDNMLAEYKYWSEITKLDSTKIPVDNSQSEGLVYLDSNASFVLDKSHTDLLQTTINTVYNTDINDILLTSLGLAIRDVFGLERTVIEMEGHGREDIINDIDISRTLGWFTSLYPFVLDLSNSSNNISSLVNVKESLRKIPNKGVGYGILKYLTSELTNDIEPSIVFNYLGDFGNSIGDSEDSIFEFSSENIGSDTASENGQDALLDVSGITASGQLSISIRYSRLLHNSDTIEKLSNSYRDHLTSLISDLAIQKQSHLTPSDLTFKDLSLEELSQLNVDNTIEDIYKLSPLQQGIYYHWLSDNSSTMYFEQMSYRLRTQHLNPDIVKEAYDQLIARHAILRTGFTNGYGGVALQIVRKEVPSNFIYTRIFENVEASDLEDYVAEAKYNDRKQGFELEGPSQMRLTVLDMGEGLYEFIWSHHHILMDGWCMSILINDFYQLLNAIGQNEHANLPTPSLYSNYIEWLDGINEKASLEYWKNYLYDYNNVAEIPFKIVNDTNQTYHSCKEVLSIENDMFSGLNSLCNQMGITQNTFLQGVWGYLLSKYNNTNDVVFGAVVSGRPGELRGVEHMIGLFINTIPVRIKYNTTDTPTSLLKSVHDHSIEGNSHHYLNLSEVQSQSELGMDLLDHIMVFENYPIQDAIKDDFEKNQEEQEEALTIESIDLTDQTNYDFSIDIEPTVDSLSIKFNYNGNVYSPESIAILASHFQKLVTGFIHNPNQHLSSLNYLTSLEEENVLTVFNNTNTPYNLDKTFIDVFKSNVESSPDKVAVICDHHSFSYKEVDVLSDKLASYIQQEFNVEKETIIGAQLERNSWLLIAALATFKVGGVYLPIDPSYPEERIAFLLTNSGCKCVLDETFLKSFQAQKETVSTTYDPVELSNSDLAYVIYTSGSTGNPKGVMIEHFGMLNHMYAMRDELQLNADSIIVQNAPSTFDISIWQLLNSLLVGGTTSIYSPATVLDPEYFLNRLQDEGVTILQVVPSYLKTLLETEENLTNKYLNTLSYLLVTGEAVTIDLIDNWFTQYPDIKVVNAYGPAEASDDVTLHIMESCPSGSSVPVGKPIQNMEILILDDDMNLCGYTIVGEICVSGIGVARGYLNNEALTKEKFVENRFRESKKLYKTGDLGRWLPNGTIEFIGRKDYQVKIRGHRIEIGEVEYQLLSKEDIDEVVISVTKSVSGDNELAAYFVSNVKQKTSDLREFLYGKLPGFMCPTYFIQLDSLPLTVNGKVDRKKLPDPKEMGLSNQTEYVPPKNDLEEQLIQILAEELGRNEKEIGAKDNFFDLGVNSIKLLRILNVINKEFNLNIRPALLFEFPNVHELVENVFYKTSENNEDEEDINLSEELNDILELME